jgi:hypothetical protein
MKPLSVATAQCIHVLLGCTYVRAYVMRLSTRYEDADRGVLGDVVLRKLLDPELMGYGHWRCWLGSFQLLSGMEASVFAVAYGDSPVRASVALRALLHERRCWCSTLFRAAGGALEVLTGATVFLASEGRVVLDTMSQFVARLESEIAWSPDGTAPPQQVDLLPDEPPPPPSVMPAGRELSPVMQLAFGRALATHLSPLENRMMSAFISACGMSNATLLWDCFSPMLARRVAVTNRLLQLRSHAERWKYLCGLSDVAARSYAPVRDVTGALRGFARRLMPARQGSLSLQPPTTTSAAATAAATTPTPTTP